MDKLVMYISTEGEMLEAVNKLIDEDLKNKEEIEKLRNEIEKLKKRPQNNKSMV